MSSVVSSAIVVLSCLLLAACAQKSPSIPPTIEFTKLPRYGQGDPAQVDQIEGRATGVQTGEKIVLYAKSGVWWVQPLAASPFTTVRSDSTWKNQTHPGIAYAALVVRAGYRPLSRTAALPTSGGDVLAVALAEGPPLAKYAETPILFGGYQWYVRQSPSSPGGTLNYYDYSNAWTDRDGFLHLRIAGTPGNWTSADVGLKRSLGYGTYRFVVRGVTRLEPSVVFTMLTVDNSTSLRSMAFEISKWGEPASRNGQFVIQPYHVPANTIQFQTPSGNMTYILRWTPGRGYFKAERELSSGGQPKLIREHVFSSGIPSPGNESIHFNFYVFGNASNPLQRGSEVVIEKFEYLP